MLRSCFVVALCVPMISDGVGCDVFGDVLGVIFFCIYFYVIFMFI